MLVSVLKGWLIFHNITMFIIQGFPLSWNEVFFFPLSREKIVAVIKN